MDPKLTPEQTKQLNSWVSQRDSILLDIASKKTESEKLSAINKGLASSNTEIADKIQQSIGRLAELEIKEEERRKLVSFENLTLISEKIKLQTEVESLKKEIALMIETKKNLHADIALATKIHETVFTQAGDIKKIISEIVSLSSSNAREVSNVLAEATSEVRKVIEATSQKVEVTNRLVAEVPKMIVDIHRDVLERKKFNKHKII